MGKKDLLDGLMDSLGPQTIETNQTNQRDFSKLPKSTLTVAFRIPKSEKVRLETAIRKRLGEASIAAGLKRIVFDWLNEQEQEKG